MTPRLRTAVIVAAVAFTCLSPPATPALAVAGTPGSGSSGDSLLPAFGNGGYNARSYDIALTYTSRGSITATTTMDATATQNLSSFQLDLYQLRVRSVLINGSAAAFTQRGHKLVVRPASAIAKGMPFVSTISYGGVPQTFTDPDGSRDGWQPTAGGITVLSEPVGAMTWFPVNNAIYDKATYDVSVTAPANLVVAGSGRWVSRSGDTTTPTTRWRQDEPVSPYLASITIAPLSSYTTSVGSRPVLSYIGPNCTPNATKLVDAVPASVRFLVHEYGGYPFATTGVVITTDAPYALEVASRPVLPTYESVSTVVHELAHQWFGDAVTPKDWGDIWLNEGFATYSEWLWAEQSSPGYAEKTYQHLYQKPANAPFWAMAPAALPDASQLFSGVVYERGAMTLQALRNRIGDTAFFQTLRTWYARYRYASASTANFEAVAEQVSGQDLHTLFHDWLYVAAKPVGY